MTAGICYSARVGSIAAVAGDRSQQQQLCSAHAIAASLPQSVFMPACVKSLHDNRCASSDAQAFVPSFMVACGAMTSSA